MRILLSAGEVSGDVAGARLARELRERRGEISLFGLGGPRMAEAGVEILRDTNALGTVGISESFRVVPGLVRAFASLRRRVLASPPDAAVLIANDIFHVALGRWLRGRGVPTLSYFPPQVWIWRSLARAFAPSFDEILTSFPDEERVWRAAGSSTTFVGHYLGDLLRPATEDERRRAREALGLSSGPVVAILPGSRRQRGAATRPRPPRRRAAPAGSGTDPSASFFPSPIPASRRRSRPRWPVADSRASSSRLRAATTRSARPTSRSSRRGRLRSRPPCSGRPMVITYRVAALTTGVVRSAIALGLMDSDTVGLPNLVLGRRAIPERIQRQATGAEIAAAASRLLEDASLRAEQRQALAEVSRLLFAGGSDARAAEAVLAAAEGRPVRVPAFGGTVATEEGSGR